ncbi:6-bladed beta-propeller [Algoriphagus marinus]|uniref:6-bladed beta-propeller n=1 Tax=Algoriphagus marinus TaxID=1925762 RepID=UPI0009FB2057|nr:6-bladed beta-propeller [Algoriphagus marinus]
MMKKIYLLFLITVAFACGEPTNVETHSNESADSVNETTELLVSKMLGDPLIYMDDHFEFLDLIALKTPEEIIISEITKATLEDSEIFIHDKKLSSLHHFNLNGDYLKSFGAMGEGPGEFLDIGDFAVVGNKICIMSKSKKGLLFYDRATGVFLNEFRYDLYGDKIAHIGNDEFLVYTNFNVNDEHGSYNVFRIDSEGSVKEKYFPFDEDKQHSMVSMSGYLAKTGNDIYFGLPFDQFVFSYNKDDHNFFPKYSTDMLSQYILENKGDFDAILKPEVLIKSFGGESWNGSTYFETNSKIYLSLYDLSSLKNVLIDKNTNEVITISKRSENPFFKLIDDPVMMAENNELFFPIYGEKVLSDEYFTYTQSSDFQKRFIDKRDSYEKDHSYFLLKTRIK